MLGELTCEGIVDLEEDLDFGEVGVEVKPDAVDGDGDCGLGNPR